VVKKEGSVDKKVQRILMEIGIEVWVAVTAWSCFVVVTVPDLEILGKFLLLGAYVYSSPVHSALSMEHNKSSTTNCPRFHHPVHHPKFGEGALCTSSVSRPELW
jgi:hypothetical protein